MRPYKLVSAVLLAATISLAARPVYAHGFGERYDLPVPLDYFLVGAGAVVALSFVVVGVSLRPAHGNLSYPRFNLLAMPVLGRVLSSRALPAVVGVVSVVVFFVVLAAGLVGSERPLENISPTFVWIIWWVGMGYVAALIGNLWALVNPWKITFGWAEKLLGDDDGEEAALFDYDERWDIWPAVGLFGAFAWLENVYGGASEPFKLGVLVLAYSAITWAGMVAFGKHKWLRHGEAFSVLYGFFARFSPTEVRVTGSAVCATCTADCDSDDECVDCYECFEQAHPGQRELNVRPYAVGLAHVHRVSTATAVFVVAALATVTFDGIVETPRWVRVQTEVYDVADALFGAYALESINTAGLFLFPAVFFGVFLAFSWGIRELGREKTSVQQVARAFVFSLVPIALAYNMAHFLSLLLIQGQLIIPLASDPFGTGWDIFGTADYVVDIAIINAKFVWFMSVVAIVVGHISSVYVAHVISLRRLGDRRDALRSQYPMLVLMVGYTATSLWIIAQPIVEE
ncbi:MAG: hypothetical protein O3A47_00185 [Chloroflexi bacterium]|nr:hypothetical protein [Chloroflexota bacterium]